MNYKKAFIFLTTLALTFSILGGLAGYFIGSKFPGYYRSIFSNGNNPNFDPIAVGVGQGIPQGFIGGIIIGLITVFILSKKQKINEEKPES